MKSYLECLEESVSVFHDTKNLGKDDLHHLIQNGNLTHEHVKGILSNPHLHSVDGVRELATRAGSLEQKSVGLVTMHAMGEKDKQVRNQLAYHLVTNGKLNDVTLKHIAKHALGPTAPGTQFDDHLALKIHRASANPDDMKSYIDKIKKAS